MVCIDQMTAERREEPLSTLAKTRRMGGKVLFGRHVGLSDSEKEQHEYNDDDDDNHDHNDLEEDERGHRAIMVGDLVVPAYE